MEVCTEVVYSAAVLYSERPGQYWPQLQLVEDTTQNRVVEDTFGDIRRHSET